MIMEIAAKSGWLSFRGGNGASADRTCSLISRKRISTGDIPQLVEMYAAIGRMTKASSIPSKVDRCSSTEGVLRTTGVIKLRFAERW